MLNKISVMLQESCTILILKLGKVIYRVSGLPANQMRPMGIICRVTPGKLIPYSGPQFSSL